MALNNSEFTESPVTSESTLRGAENSTYSTLEVHHGRFIEADSTSAPIVRSEPDPTSVPIVRPEPDSSKIVTYDHNADKEIIVTETALPDGSDSTNSTPEQKILGLRRKTFFIVLAAIIVIVAAAAIGGGVGGVAAAAASRSKEQTTQTSNSTNTTTTATSTVAAALYANTGLAVMQWTDQNGVLHKKLYYQDKTDKVRESAWDNSTDFNTDWTIETISDGVKPGTPIAAVAGYPHASYNYTLVSVMTYGEKITNDG